MRAYPYLGAPRRLALAVLLVGSASSALMACEPSDAANVDDWPPSNGTFYDGGFYNGVFYDGGFVVASDGAVVPVVVTNVDGGAVFVPVGDGGPSNDASFPPPADGGQPDAAVVSDAGVDDASTTGGGGIDAGTDAGVVDAGIDAGRPDAGTPDAGRPDAGTPDAGRPDAGTPDAGAPAIKSCTVVATTVAPSGVSYAPAYGSALWVNDSAGKLVKKFVVYGNGSHTSLSAYNTSVRSVAGVDTTTSATLRANKSYSFTWDLKNPSGATVGDGSYTFQIETRSGAGDRLVKVPFTKGTSAVNASVADGSGVTGAKVTCQ